MYMYFVQKCCINCKFAIYVCNIGDLLLVFCLSVTEFKYSEDLLPLNLMAPFSCDDSASFCDAFH